MSALAEFLHKQSGTLKVKTEANRQTIAEWRGAVEALFAKLRGWMAEADPEGVLLVEEGETEIDESDLGRYKMPRLELRTARRRVSIAPNCRNTVVTAIPPFVERQRRSSGRVDLVGGTIKYALFRLPEAGGDAWYIDDRDEQKPLDRAAFEAALLRCLQ